MTAVGMQIELATSDVVILSLAAACLVGVVVLELLRVVVPDIYEWVADHAKIQREIKEARPMLERTLAQNMDQGALRDRRNAERFRMKSQLSRLEMMLMAAERERVQVWHHLGQQAIGDSLFCAKMENRKLADLSAKDFDSAPIIWRYHNQIRVWAPSEHQARLMLTNAFPPQEGFVVRELITVSRWTGLS
jgi:hypothetical protein